MAKKPNQLRIIGGRWRGRKISFPELPDLRPTPDRVRETLFNWLAPELRDSRCLDLFAGSGALGLEALSRGAEFVQFIDQSSVAVNYLNQTLNELSAKNVLVSRFDAQNPISKPQQGFNIVFLDPPFKSNLLSACCQWLSQPGYLAANAYIYIEAPKELSNLPIPLDWSLFRSRIAGQVSYNLFMKQ